MADGLAYRSGSVDGFKVGVCRKIIVIDYLRSSSARYECRQFLLGTLRLIGIKESANLASQI
jgi:hypothetical protein